MKRKLTLAIYADADGKYEYNYFREYELNDDGTERWEKYGGLVRITEPVEVEFVQRDKKEIDAVTLEQIDGEIAHEVAKHEEKMKELRNRKALLTFINSDYVE